MTSMSLSISSHDSESMVLSTDAEFEQHTSRFTGQKVLITGAGSGIGKAITSRFAAEGADLILADLDEAALTAIQDQVDERIEGSSISMSGDLTNRADVVALVDLAVQRFGNIDVLINCAGGGVILPTLDHTEETLRATIDRNLWTTLYVTLEVLPHMVAQSYGRIVNIGAESVRNGLYRHAVYNAAKGEVDAFGTGLAREFASNGITVNTVATDWVVTPEAEQKLQNASVDVQQDMEAFGAQMVNRIPMGRPGTVEEVSAAVAFVASEEASFVTGQVISVNGGSSML